jgi:hypothetical protein
MEGKPFFYAARKGVNLRDKRVVYVLCMFWDSQRHNVLIYIRIKGAPNDASSKNPVCPK